MRETDAANGTLVFWKPTTPQLSLRRLLLVTRQFRCAPQSDRLHPTLPRRRIIPTVRGKGPAGLIYLSWDFHTGDPRGYNSEMRYFSPPLNFYLWLSATHSPAAPASRFSLGGVPGTYRDNDRALGPTGFREESCNKLYPYLYIHWILWKLV